MVPRKVARVLAPAGNARSRRWGAMSWCKNTLHVLVSFIVIARAMIEVNHIFIKHVQKHPFSTCNNLGVTMPIANDRRNQNRQKDDQRNCENVISRLGSAEGQSISTRHESDTVFYPNSEGGYQAGSWVAPQGQATLGGIYRRLTELHETCLSLIDSQQKQLENSLHNSKQLTAEINDLQRLLAETLDNDIVDQE